jgi:calcium channel MID1
MTMTPPSHLTASNFSLLLFKTSSAPSSSIPRTACALRTASNITGNFVNETLWTRDSSGWRNEWLFDGLSPQTNYTAYAVVNETQVSGPSFFVTKSGETLRASFSMGADN